jgi:hypothetical protein
MRTALRALSIALSLAAFLSLPGAASEPAAACADWLRAPEANAAPQAPAASLDVILGHPKPQEKLAETSCDNCPGGTGGPSLQCHRQCRAQGLCTDQCYADASTCQLTTCICLLC